MNNIQLLWLRFRAYLRGEICPSCKSWKIKKGSGYGGLKCIECYYEFINIDTDNQPSAPQNYGQNTIYEEYIST
jgi:hypothetical protein